VAWTKPQKRFTKRHCAACHGAQRLGGIGPALLPQNLSRLRKKAALEVIGQGRPLTQMPAFSGQLDDAELDALADFIYQPPAEEPNWGLADIRASHVVHHPKGSLDSFEPIYRFQTRYALHGGPKYSSDGRYVFFASRDGWISKFDIYNLKVVAEIRAGINTRNAAVSFNNKYVAVGNYLPHSLVLLSADDLSPLAVLPMTDGAGNSSRVSAVYTAPPRESFIVALKDIPQILEIPYALRAHCAGQSTG
jgi:hypothetical protein